MKLIFCPDCYDVFKLDYRLRKCVCGRCAGKYIDDTYAIVNGEGYSIAIGNGSLMDACIKGTVQRKERHIPESNIICWARPHDGPSNPHTVVNPKLGEEETNEINS